MIKFWLCVIAVLGLAGCSSAPRNQDMRVMLERGAVSDMRELFQSATLIRALENRRECLVDVGEGEARHQWPFPVKPGIRLEEFLQDLGMHFTQARVASKNSISQTVWGADPLPGDHATEPNIIKVYSGDIIFLTGGE